MTHSTIQRRAASYLMAHLNREVLGSPERRAAKSEFMFQQWADQAFCRERVAAQRIAKAVREGRFRAIPYEECLRRLLNRQRTVMA